MRQKGLFWALVALSALLLSIPWLVPHTGYLVLVGFVPLLCADAVADQFGGRHFWWYHYSAFVLWNAATTFWVCNATVGGGIFAVLVNALQMSIVWALFRLSKKRFKGILPYIFLAAAWIAWERVYYSLDISWPWLVLGNAFARTTSAIQWYEYTGVLGGSLWIWACNLAVFGIVVSVTDGHWSGWKVPARAGAVAGLAVLLVLPPVASSLIYKGYQEQSEGTLDVIAGQPNFDPYEKFTSKTQKEQTAELLDLFEDALQDRTPGEPVLLLAPETFTSDVCLNQPEDSPTMVSVRAFLAKHPGAEMLFGASTYEFFNTHAAPSILARQFGDRWLETHNSAILADGGSAFGLYHKSKLVVGTELTPYPKLFVPLDNFLSRLFKVSGGLIARCIGQDEVSLLDSGAGVPLGCAICYESVYGEYCTEYVQKGARAMTVITNDAWWGDTPGYRQHMSYSRLRAIELRRDIARCGNTGISCFIDQKGDVISETEWWKAATLSGTLNLNSKETFFVRHGDLAGRICTLLFLVLFLLLAVRLVWPGRQKRVG